LATSTLRFCKMRKKTASRPLPRKVSRLLLSSMPGQSAEVPPSPMTSSSSSASTSSPPASLEAPVPLALEPAPPALALPSREARVDEEATPEALAVLVPKAEPSSLRR
jgi:hypothetical protein